MISDKNALPVPGMCSILKRAARQIIAPNHFIKRGEVVLPVVQNRAELTGPPKPVCPPCVEIVPLIAAAPKIRPSMINPMVMSSACSCYLVSLLLDWVGRRRRSAGESRSDGRARLTGGDDRGKNDWRNRNRRLRHDRGNNARGNDNWRSHGSDDAVCVGL